MHQLPPAHKSCSTHNTAAPQLIDITTLVMVIPEICAREGVAYCLTSAIHGYSSFRDRFLEVLKSLHTRQEASGRPAVIECLLLWEDPYVE